MSRITPHSTIPEEAEPILPHRQYQRPRSSGSFRPTTTYGSRDPHRRIAAPAPVALRAPAPRARHGAQSFATSARRPANLAQRSAVTSNRSAALSQRSAHSLVMANRPANQRAMYRHPQLLPMDHRPTSSASRIFHSSSRASLASNEGALRYQMAQGRTTPNHNPARLTRRASARRARCTSSRLRSSHKPVISSRPPKIQHTPQDQNSSGYSSDDTCLSYTTSKATTTTAIGSPPELGKKPSTITKHRPSVYVKEFTAPSLFQSNIDLGTFSKRQSPSSPRKQASDYIYWVLYITGFFLFPAWIIGYVVAALTIGLPPNHRSSMQQLVDSTPNPLHLRWKTRFLNTLLIFIAIVMLVALVIIASHPSWFPYKSKILTIGKH
ncbi:hypothetical protein DSO57_1022915 [Entomophthora muscae]|uniref:Uncharacterized protein n=1 Tax=Entomophthora muscae TaxID=34485 RepID=A0ACC2SRW4_9FUNG|nr:hypothetical protein DSO57_1022915 [Entomophthora muscae]